MMPTPPVPRVPRDSLPPAMQAAHDRALASRGDATFVDVLGHTPELFEWYGEFYSRVFYGGRVPVRIKELIRLRLSTVHGCAFCNRGNRLDAVAAGLSDAQLLAIGDETATCWSPAERAALQLAAAMALTAPRGHLNPALYAELRSHFDDAQIVELGMTMAVLTGMAKFLFAYDLVEKEDYCEFGAR
ncbi:MAG: carboxymuconolactone decarboxylase family protein [Gammaproteobacteria bacterium]|nr:carboxymuconolactone decarboxylase family protein [Gammaproteobacteria bacterium]